MLFNSWEFLLVFLPFTFLSWLLLNRALFPLLVASIFFYLWWNPLDLPILLVSILTNFLVMHKILARKHSKKWLVSGIVFNLGLLCWFKYSLFIASIIQQTTGLSLLFSERDLPLAISFFTFQQIACLVDAYKKKICAESLVNYSFFVIFFPQAIAGPIVHISQILPQIKALKNQPIRWEWVSTGFFLFLLGLAKKVLIADSLSPLACNLFDSQSNPNFIESLHGSLAYTLQLYFDFSGYADMTVGLGMMFGIILPQNFNAPYKATNIQDFWRRWHITLGKWLKDYVFIPLGGSKGSSIKTSRNLFLTFLLGGIWHGAGWTFIVWGIWHGLGIVIHRLWMNMGKQISKIPSIFLTFLFVHIGWIFFRSPDLERSIVILNGFYNLDFAQHNNLDFVIIFIGMILCWFFPTANQLVQQKGYLKLKLLTAFILSLLIANKLDYQSVFLYFQF